LKNVLHTIFIPLIVRWYIYRIIDCYTREKIAHTIYRIDENYSATVVLIWLPFVDDLAVELI